MEAAEQARLCTWLDEHVPECGSGPLQWEVLAGGATNIVMAISRGGARLALRRPPQVPRPDSGKVLAREATLLRALTGTSVPVPALHAHCEDESVIGAPFYVFDLIDGWSVRPREEINAAFASRDARRALAFAMVDGIAELALVDYKAVGLEGFGRPENFLARQVDRWLAHHASYGQSENYAFRPIPGKDEVVEWLRANVPETPHVGIIHGDYGFANVMFRHDQPPRLAGMIDWELSTIGDPLLDLGWLLYGFKGERETVDPPSVFYHPDYPSREELAAHYAAKTGRDVSNLRYYLILAQFKLSLLLERHYARGLNGRMPREIGEEIGQLALNLMQRAADMAAPTS